MSCYWAIQGIGIEACDIFKHLNKQKWFDAVKSLHPDWFEEGAEPVINADSFDIRDFDNLAYEHGYMSLAVLFCELDDSRKLTWICGGDTDTEYFLYKPSYPWEREEDDPRSIEDVYGYFVSLLRKITDLSKQEIIGLIDDEIDTYGMLLKRQNKN